MTRRHDGWLYAAVLALSSVVFVALAAAVLFWGAADRLDVRFVLWVRQTAPDLLVETMEVLTYAGSIVILGPLVVGASALLVRRGQRGPAVLVVAALIGSQALAQALKAAFQRGRPEFEDPFVQLTTFAFPSGHAFAATATYGALALVLASSTRSKERRVLLLGAAVVLIAIVAASRVIVGRHFLFDVTAGIAGGIALLCALLLLLQRARHPALHVGLFSRYEEPQRAGVDP